MSTQAERRCMNMSKERASFDEAIKKEIFSPECFCRRRYARVRKRVRDVSTS